MSKKNSYKDLNNDIQRKQAELKALKKQQRNMKKREETEKNARVGDIVREVFSEWHIDEATDENLKIFFVGLREREKDFRAQQRAQQQQ